MRNKKTTLPTRSRTVPDGVRDRATAPVPRLPSGQDFAETAQVVAALALTIPNLRVDVVPQLVYLVDRISYARHGHAVLRGPRSSTPDGPVHDLACRMTERMPRYEAWSTLLTVEHLPAGTMVRPLFGIGTDDLDLLSDAALEVAVETTALYGSKTREDLRDLFGTHPDMADCRPTEKRRPIADADLLVGTGMDRATAEAIADEQARLQAVIDLLNS